MSIEAGFGGPNDGNDKYSDDKSLLEAVYGHDKKLGELLDALKDCSEVSSGERNDMMNVVFFRANQTASSFIEATSVLASSKECTDEELVGMVTSLFIDGEKKRSEYLNGLLPDPVLEPAFDGDVNKLTEEFRQAIDVIKSQEIEDSRGATVSAIGKVYARYMEDDLDTFVAALDSAEHDTRTQQNQEKGSSSMKESAKRALPKLGRHALDVLKSATGVSLGVAAGMVIGSAINKKRK